MSEKQTPTLLEAIQSGKCFGRNGNIYKFKNDAMYMWVQGEWKLTEESIRRVEYCDDPSLQPRPCTFMEAWEHMQKYPGKDVVQWRHLRCRYLGGDIYGDICTDSDYDLFREQIAAHLINSDQWKLIPQEEGE